MGAGEVRADRLAPVKDETLGQYRIRSAFGFWTDPASGGSMPARIRSNAVFPQPFGPINPA